MYLLSARKTEGKPETSEAEKKEEQWPAIEPGTYVSDLVDAVIVLAAILLIGFVIKAIRHKTGP